MQTTLVFAGVALMTATSTRAEQIAETPSSQPAEPLAHASPGTLIWQDQYDQAVSYDVAQTVASAKKAVVVAGVTTDADFVTTILVRAYDSKDGALLWQRRIDANGNAKRTTALGTKLSIGRDGPGAF